MYCQRVDTIIHFELLDGGQFAIDLFDGKAQNVYDALEDTPFDFACCWHADDCRIDTFSSCKPIHQRLLPQSHQREL